MHQLQKGLPRNMDGLTGENAMYPNYRSTDELAAVESSIAAVTNRIEVIDVRIDTGTDDQNAQDERRDLQRQLDQLELQRDQLELRLTVPPFTGTLSKAQAQALVDEHKIQALLDREDFQVLVQDNPTLAQAYATVALIARCGT